MSNLVALHCFLLGRGSKEALHTKVDLSVIDPGRRFGRQPDRHFKPKLGRVQMPFCLCTDLFLDRPVLYRWLFDVSMLMPIHWLALGRFR